MSADRHQQIRLHAFRQDITLTQWANRALNEYVAALGERPPMPADRPELKDQMHGPMFTINPVLERRVKKIKYEHGINACDWVPHVLLDKLEAEAAAEARAATMTTDAEREPARYTEAEIMTALAHPEVQRALARALVEAVPGARRA